MLWIDGEHVAIHPKGANKLLEQRCKSVVKHSIAKPSYYEFT